MSENIILTDSDFLSSSPRPLWTLITQLFSDQMQNVGITSVVWTNCHYGLTWSCCFWMGCSPFLSPWLRDFSQRSRPDYIKHWFPKAKCRATGQPRLNLPLEYFVKYIVFLSWPLTRVIFSAVPIISSLILLFYLPIQGAPHNFLRWTLAVGTASISKMNMT